ncbi:hypothetical protein O181_057819 [Austropuccinia psidii MF-1]|uniref:Peptidase A2 domain-containing protein n=1 Tax=Austropuccinia psidii MF-1 TaxID=1389203 RepID=A0A9Q3EB92_9BASI|nr:hypothetical protein [Austropuccinia psidii MF-1]
MNPLPPFSFSYQPYIPAQMAPRPPLRCAYCKGEGHSATRFTHLSEDLDKIIVRTQGASYLFPNYQIVPMEGNESARNILRAFCKGTSRTQQEIYGETCEQPEEEIENIANKNEDEDSQKEKKVSKHQKKQVEGKLEIDKIITKIMQQRINLTIEEILRMSPNFVHKLPELSEKHKEKIKSLNSMDFQERLLTFGFKEIPKPKIHYACPLGFMEIFIGKEEYLIRELVDTGAELHIIPEEIAIKSSLTTRKLNMNLRGIGGHTTSLVALSEFTPIILASGEEIQIQFFIAKGSVHTVLGRPFLKDNNIRLEFSHRQGEILSYQEHDGRRLCMPICKPQALGWQTGPPRGMDLCNMAKVVSNSPGKKFQNAKGDNTIMKLTHKTQELSISPKSDKFSQDLQNKKWKDKLKQQLEESIYEDELPNIIYKQIDDNEEIFQILFDGSEKINGNPFKTKPKRKSDLVNIMRSQMKKL